MIHFEDNVLEILFITVVFKVSDITVFFEVLLIKETIPIDISIEDLTTDHTFGKLWVVFMSISIEHKGSQKEFVNSSVCILADDLDIKQVFDDRIILPLLHQLE